MFMSLFLISSRETLIIDSCSRLFRSLTNVLSCDQMLTYWHYSIFKERFIPLLLLALVMWSLSTSEFGWKLHVSVGFLRVLRSSLFIFSIVQSIMPTIGIITGVAKVSCAIALLKSASSDDHIFLTLLKFFWNYCFVVRSTRSFYQLLNTCNYHLQPLVK